DGVPQRQICLKPSHGIQEVYVHASFNIFSPQRSIASTGASSTEKLLKTAIAKQVIQVARLKSIRTAGLPRLLLPLLVSSGFFSIESGAQSLLAELIVQFPLFRIADDFVGYGDLFKFVLSGFVAG